MATKKKQAQPALKVGCDYIRAQAEMYAARTEDKTGKHAKTLRALSKSLHTCADVLEDAGND